MASIKKSLANLLVFSDSLVHSDLDPLESSPLLIFEKVLITFCIYKSCDKNLSSETHPGNWVTQYCLIADLIYSFPLNAVHKLI